MRLLNAAAALQLVEARGNDRWGLGALGAVMVNDQAIGAMVQHHGAFYADLADPVALLRGASGSRQLASYWAYASAARPEALTASEVAEYSALMSASQPLVAEQILDVVNMQSHRCLLDVGGGEGRFLVAAARRAPRLELMLVDLPAVAARAQASLHAQGLAVRSRVHGADFLSDPLPKGADIVSLVRVVHDHDDASVMALLRAARAALPVGGTLLLAEPMAGTPGAARMADAYFGLYLLAMQSGRPRSAQQLTTMLHGAGFDGVHERPTRQPLQTRVLLARASTLSNDVNAA
jgi:demethylspheroidene O-methyltransferase